MQGCYSEGNTKEQALDIIKDAIKLHLKDKIENDEPLYEEVFADKVEVTLA